MRRSILSIVFISTLCSLGLAQNSVTISAAPRDLSRPVSTLLLQLRKREKIPVTYEDPRYAKRDDMEGKNVNFTYSVDEMHSAEGPELVIGRMIREYSAAGGLTFAIVKDGPRLHVVPNEVLDRTGTRVRQESILDTAISVPARQRDGGELLQAICDEIKKQTGYEVGIGPSVPGNYLARYKTREAISNMRARTAVQALLDRATPPSTFVWDLYFDPADGGYGLNFAYVGPAGQLGKTAK